MFIHEILNPDYVPLRASNTVADGLEAMDEQHVDVIALIDFTTGRLLGVINRESLVQESDLEQTLFSKLQRNPYTISSDLHVADALREMHLHNKDFAVVTDPDKMYTGIVFRKDMQNAISGLLNSGREGSVIMVELAPSDYSLIDLVRIIESEGARILSLGVDTPGNQEQRFRVSVKLNTDDIDPILRALNRYGYVITSKTENTGSDEELHDRADEFMRFLNI